MPKKKDRQLVRREAIIQAASEIFAMRGFQGSTVEEIARKAGVAKGTPYLYFSDKADLFYAVFENWAKEVMTGAQLALSAASSASEKLLALALSAVEYMDSHREWFPLSLEVWAASSTPLLRERFASALQGLYAAYRTETSAIIRAGQGEGEFSAEVDADALAALLTGAIDGLLLQCWFDSSLDAGKLVRGFFDALLRGIQSPGKG